VISGKSAISTETVTGAKPAVEPTESRETVVKAIGDTTKKSVFGDEDDADEERRKEMGLDFFVHPRFFGDAKKQQRYADKRESTRRSNDPEVRAAYEKRKYERIDAEQARRDASNAKNTAANRATAERRGTEPGARAIARKPDGSVITGYQGPEKYGPQFENFADPGATEGLWDIRQAGDARDADLQGYGDQGPEPTPFPSPYDYAQENGPGANWRDVGGKPTQIPNTTEELWPTPQAAPAPEPLSYQEQLDEWFKRRHFNEGKVNANISSLPLWGGQ